MEPFYDGYILILHYGQSLTSRQYKKFNGTDDFSFWTVRISALKPVSTKGTATDHVSTEILD